MGVVYTPEQIKRHDVPSPGEHRRAGAFVLHHLATLRQQDSSFHGGMIYGSTTMSPSIRSDLDVLTISDPETATAESFDAIARMSLETAEAFHVRPELNTLVLGEHSTPDDHNLDTLFGTHLKRVMIESPKWVVGDIQQRIPFEPLTPASAIDALHQYATHKERRFLKSLAKSLDEEIDYTALQRAFELPSALGRKAVTALHYALGDQRDSATAGRERLSEACETLLRTQSRNPLALQAHRDLVTMDHEYTELLKDTLAGRASGQQYEAWIHDITHPALHHARTLATAWKTACVNHIQQ